MEAAHEATACEPQTALTMPLPNKLAAENAFWMWLIAIVASLRIVARLKVSKAVQRSQLTGIM